MTRKKLIPREPTSTPDWTMDGLEYCIGYCRSPSKTRAVAERVMRSEDPMTRELALLVIRLLQGAHDDPLVRRAFGLKPRGGESEKKRDARLRRAAALRRL